MMQHRGYVAKVEFDGEVGIFHGEVINTKDVITFQGTTVKELRRAFRDSIDDYLAFCKERGEAPDKPFSGQFVARVSPELHRSINAAAMIKGMSLNAWVREQLQKAVKHLLPRGRRLVRSPRGTLARGRSATRGNRAASRE